MNFISYKPGGHISNENREFILTMKLISCGNGILSILQVLRNLINAEEATCWSSNLLFFRQNSNNSIALSTCRTLTKNRVN